MSQMIKSYLVVFLLLFMTYTEVSILEAGGDIVAANNYHSEMIMRSEAANYEPIAIANLKQEAKKKGYEVTLIQLDEINGKSCYKIVMDYEVKLPFLNVTKKESISGIAR